MGIETIKSFTEKDLQNHHFSVNMKKENMGERHWKPGFIRLAVHSTTPPIGCKQQ